MAISLARPSPRRIANEWALQCSTRAAMLRRCADSASPLQAERAVVEYGAAAALEKAVGHWLTGHQELARTWMRAAENQLTAALIELPWEQPSVADRGEERA